MYDDLTNAKIYSEEIRELISDVQEVDYKADLLVSNFKEMFLELSTNN